MRRLIQILRNRWLIAMASQFGLTTHDGIGQVHIATDLALDVVLSLSKEGVRITGFPRLAFSPRVFPYKLFAAMLIRNSENALGAWQLTANRDQVICSYSCVVPYRWATRIAIKRAIEATLSEVDEVAQRYHSIEMI